MAAAYTIIKPRSEPTPAGRGQVWYRTHVQVGKPTQPVTSLPQFNALKGPLKAECVARNLFRTLGKTLKGQPTVGRSFTSEVFRKDEVVAVAEVLLEIPEASKADYDRLLDNRKHKHRNQVKSLKSSEFVRGDDGIIFNKASPFVPASPASPAQAPVSSAQAATVPPAAVQQAPAPAPSPQIASAAETVTSNQTEEGVHSTPSELNFEASEAAKAEHSEQNQLTFDNVDDPDPAHAVTSAPHPVVIQQETPSEVTSPDVFDFYWAIPDELQEEVRALRTPKERHERRRMYAANIEQYVQEQWGMKQVTRAAITAECVAFKITRTASLSECYWPQMSELDEARLDQLQSMPQWIDEVRLLSRELDDVPELSVTDSPTPDSSLHSTPFVRGSELPPSNAPAKISPDN